jgi:hypothetical protein
MRIQDPGWKKFGPGIRDGKKSDTGSGKTSRIPNTEKSDPEPGINIPDPQH